VNRRLSRRSFLAGIPAFAGAATLIRPVPAPAQDVAGPVPPPDSFPRVDLATIETFVGVAHRDAAEVRRMVERQPALARAAWDWGFGDWETALGAAAHTGQREIAELVLAHGAHPTIFSAAMLGQLDVVRAMVAAAPGIQRTLGPHALTLMFHARKGGKDAEPVVSYLESVGEADTGPTTAPLDPADRDALVGRYVFGAGESDRVDVDVRNDALGIQRPGMTRRTLSHTGGLVFFPSGVPSVRIAFARAGAAARQLTIADPEVFLTARRQA
jgi:hypothetical protein